MVFLPSSFNNPLIRILESPGPDSTVVDVLNGISIYNHVGKGVITMFCKNQPKTYHVPHFLKENADHG